MRLISLLTILLGLATATPAQSPVSWTYASRKISDNKIELSLTATISGNWHLYSQYTKEGGPVPTTISFAKNPMINFEGEVKETGTLHEKYEEVFEMKVSYYQQTVTFKQIVTLKKKIKTKIAGTIKFMVCNDTQCLPPKTESFSIAL
jgi:thiol:disulfide interchange protein DsbD